MSLKRFTFIYLLKLQNNYIELTYFRIRLVFMNYKLLTNKVYKTTFYTYNMHKQFEQYITYFIILKNLT